MTPLRLPLALLLALSGSALAQSAGEPIAPGAEAGPPARVDPPGAPPPIPRIHSLPPPEGGASDARALVAEAVLPGLAARCLPAAGDPPPGGYPWTPPPARAAATRVVIAVDASGSMAGRAGGEVKMEAARRAARRFLETLSPGVEVGLVVFGHRGSPRDAGRATSCAAAEPVVPLSPAGRAAALSAVDGLRPVGWTPLAAAMRAAAAQFRPAEVPGEQLLLVISDGIETCGGNPAAVAREISEGPTRAAVDIIGFDIPGRDREVMGEVARAARGSFAPVTDSATAALAMRRSAEGTLAASPMAQPPTAQPPTAQPPTALARPMPPEESRRDGRIGPPQSTVAVASCINGGLAEEATRLEIALSRPGSPPATAATARALLEERHRAARTALSDVLAALGAPSGAALAAARERLAGVLTVFAR
ncbi:vWA domain-containing protein [Roseomonas mucosa]|uniref:vWA domain-containing protein n=1 Tax=Roseomonas mucosa TaxID=207340 RepID=UPI0028CC448D|nr:VWA domain-containing protein [Roseomonas mucosa]MDT8351012.1 VWA domain-containing protein [Roseomonas mucosa]